MLKYTYEDDQQRIGSYYMDIKRPPVIINQVSSYGYKNSQETKGKIVDSSNVNTSNFSSIIDKDILTLSSIVQTSNLKQNQIEFNKDGYKMNYSPYQTISEINIMSKQLLPVVNTKREMYLNSLIKERTINSMRNTKMIGESYS